jgi:hypothetical protein
MTEKLLEAIERIQQMPEDRQELLAKLMLHEIEEDEKWTRSTETIADKLRGLIGEGLKGRAVKAQGAALGHGLSIP